MIHSFRQFSRGILAGEKLLFRPKTRDEVGVALIYPNCYELGINNLGFQTVYRLLHQIPGIYAERAFLYPSPFESISRTLESNRLLADFDCLAFSVAFELDFLNMARLLQWAKIPLNARDRTERFPLVVAGGMVMFMNPVPVAALVDVVFVGEAEGLLESFAELVIQARRDNWSRPMLLSHLSRIKGLYIPSVHPGDVPQSIDRHYRSLDDRKPNVSSVITGTGMFGDMYLLEVGRGCPRGCRFCAAGYVYRPYRINKLPDIKQTVNPEYWTDRPVGLVGSAVSDYAELTGLMEWILSRKGKLGISSFRIDELTGRNIELFERGGVLSIAVAPEAGSERLRRVIHKPLRTEEILQAARLVARSKIQNLKLYFMIGLPYERDADLEALVDLVGAVDDIYNEKGSSGTVKISCNAFVPKAFTPFQWSRMEQEKEIDRKRNYLRRQLQRLRNVRFISAKSTREDLLQGIFSLGDGRVSALIQGIIADNRNWKKIAMEQDYDYMSLLHRDRDYNDILPWDFIKGPVPKKYLWKEWQRAREEAGI